MTFDEEDINISIVESQPINISISGGVIGTDISTFKQRTELELAFKSSLSKYSEPTYNSDILEKITIWEDETKTNKLFTKTFTYNVDVISTIVTKDEINDITLTETFNFVGDKWVGTTEVVE
jgi:hypothetical protein